MDKSWLIVYPITSDNSDKQDHQFNGNFKVGIQTTGRFLTDSGVLCLETRDIGFGRQNRNLTFIWVH